MVIMIDEPLPLRLEHVAILLHWIRLGQSKVLLACFFFIGFTI
jgi:hypothetical protein